VASVRLIVLHKPGVRRAQLDLLRRSVAVNWPDAELFVVDAEAGPDFQRDLWIALTCWPSSYLAFACDDGVCFRRVDDRLYKLALCDSDVLCWSARLGQNTTRCDPHGAEQAVPVGVGRRVAWRWQDAEHDFGYPGSVDAHVFRADLLLSLLDGRDTPNPTALECALMDACLSHADTYPLMACAHFSSYTGVPVNRVSEQSGVVHGRVHPQTAADLEARYAAGQRIQLDRIDAAEIDAAHTEIMYEWA
jgi:hypothetical protein